MSCVRPIPTQARSLSYAHTRHLTATSTSPTKARLPTLIRLMITNERCSAVWRATPPIVGHVVRSFDSCREFLILVAAALTHLGFGVSLRNQPRADAGRDVAHFTARKLVQPDPVELELAWRFRDADLHVVVTWSKHDAV